MASARTNPPGSPTRNNTYQVICQRMIWCVCRALSDPRRSTLWSRPPTLTAIEEEEKCLPIMDLSLT